MLPDVKCCQTSPTGYSFLEHQIITFLTKEIQLKFILKLSDLKSDFKLTQGCLYHDFFALHRTTRKYTEL